MTAPTSPADAGGGPSARPPSWNTPPPPAFAHRHPGAPAYPHPAHHRPPVPARPPVRPTYRENRPVRWWTAAVAFGAGLAYYLLLGLVAWSLASFSVILVVGMLVAGGLAVVLLARGDRGGAVGLAAVTGLALAVVTAAVGLDVYVIGDGVFG